jgi:hypothetical protein
MRNEDATLQSVEALAEKAGIEEATFYVAYQKKGAPAKALIFAVSNGESAVVGCIPQDRYVRHAGLRVVAEDADRKAVVAAHTACVKAEATALAATGRWAEARRASDEGRDAIARAMDEGKKHRDQLLVLEAERSALLTAADLDDQQAVYDGRLAAMVEAAGNDEAAKEAAQAAHKACMAEVDAARAALAENDAWALRARKGIKEEAEAEAEALKAAPALEAAEAEAEAAKEAAAAALKAATAALKKAEAIEAGYQAEMVTLEGWGSLVARTRRCRVVGPPAGPPIVMLGQKRPKLRHHR